MKRHYKMVRIGYVAGVRYPKEHGTEWLYGKQGLTGYGERSHLLQTEAGAKRHLNKFTHIGEPYVREYFKEVKI